jgi:hypothetical protein
MERRSCMPRPLEATDGDQVLEVQRRSACPHQNPVADYQALVVRLLEDAGECNAAGETARVRGTRPASLWRVNTSGSSRRTSTSTSSCIWRSPRHHRTSCASWRRDARRGSPRRNSGRGAISRSAGATLPFAGCDRRWTGSPVSRAGSTSLFPHLAPGLAPRLILRPVVYAPKTTKTPRLRGFREIAGAGFEPATFGL